MASTFKVEAQVVHIRKILTIFFSTFFTVNHCPFKKQFLFTFIVKENCLCFVLNGIQLFRLPSEMKSCKLL